MINARKILILFCSAMFIGGGGTINAQSNEVNIVEASDNGSCELNLNYADQSISEAIKNNERVFIIARKATNEKAKINESRIRLSRTVLVNFRKYPADRITFASGDASDDELGKLEFWIGSKLRFISYMKKNKQICLNP